MHTHSFIKIDASQSKNIFQLFASDKMYKTESHNFNVRRHLIDAMPRSKQLDHFHSLCSPMSPDLTPLRFSVTRIH